MSVVTEKANPVFTARHAMGRTVRGAAMVARDGFSARYDLDRIAGVFSRPAHKLVGRSYVGKVLVLDTAKGGVASAWMLHEMKARGIVDSGDALTMGIGAMTEARWKAFYESQVAVGVYKAGIDISKGYSTKFVNKRVGMELKK